MTSIEDITKYKKVWMAVAILWIMLLHTCLVTGNLLVDFIVRTGYGGVDIFMFASGLGGYRSYKRHGSIAGFLKGRIIRIMPAYCIVITIWLFYNHVTNIKDILGNFFCVQQFTGSDCNFNWYMSGLWFMYLILPIVIAVYDAIQAHSLNAKMSVICDSFLFLILFLFTIPFVGGNLEGIMTRLPVFCLGILVEKYNNKSFSKRIVLLISIILLTTGTLLLWIWRIDFSRAEYGMSYYPFVLIAPAACYIISYVCHLVAKTRLGIIIDMMERIGNFTLELFLVHIFIYEITFFSHDIYVQNSALYACFICAAIICGVIAIRCIITFFRWMGNAMWIACVR